MIHLAHLGPGAASTGPASLTLQKLLRTPMQASSEPPCLCSLLSGCASPMAPVLLHSQQRHLLDTQLVISQCVSLLTWVTGSSCLCPPSTSRSQWRAGDPPCHTPCTQVIRPWSPVSSVMLCLPEVTLPPPGPDVGHVLLPQHALHPVVLGPGLDADGVHTKLPSHKNN